jgi:hypothetical protein
MEVSRLPMLETTIASTLQDFCVKKLSFTVQLSIERIAYLTLRNLPIPYLALEILFLPYLTLVETSSLI